MRNVTYGVVEYPVEITLISVQLHAPAVNISRGIGRARFRSDCRNTKEKRSFFPTFVEEARTSQIRKIVARFKFSIGTRKKMVISDDEQIVRTKSTHPTAFA